MKIPESQRFPMPFHALQTLITVWLGVRVPPGPPTFQLVVGHKRDGWGDAPGNAPRNEPGRRAGRADLADSHVYALIVVVATIVVGGVGLMLRNAPTSARDPAALVTASASSDAEIHYAPDENLEAIDVRLLDEARDRIDIAAYVLTDKPVVEALAAAGRRGVRVRVWQDAEQAERTGEADIARRLGDDRPGLEIRYKPPGQLMHLKGYCLDGVTFRSGSANFSRSGETMQDNDLIVLRSADACAKFEAKFERIWQSQ